MKQINYLAAIIAGTISTLFNTIKYNWFYLFLSILAPLIIYGMGAGREIIALLFEEEGLFLNTLFLVLTLAMMSVTIWIIPTVPIYIITAFGKLTAKVKWKRKLDFFHYLIMVYSADKTNPLNNSQIPLKYLAIIPWTMVCSTLIQFSNSYKAINSSIWIFVSLNCMFLAILVILDGIRKGKSKLYWITALIVLLTGLGIYLTIYMNRCGEDKDVFWLSRNAGKAVAIYITYISATIAMFFALNKGERWYVTLAKKQINELGPAFKANNRIHTSLFFTNLAALIILTAYALRTELPAFSTLTILFLCLNFYMILVDSLFTSQWLMADQLETITGNKQVKTGFKIFIGALFFSFIYLVLCNNTNKYKHGLAKGDYTDTATLETYFEKWYAVKRSYTNPSQPMNIYLISGQGGGSRAAVYMLAVLREIEKSRDKELYRQTFSISSISGSSAGIGQYIAQHQNERLQTFLKTTDTLTRSFDQLKEAYSYNFFNSNLLGLLFYDRLPACVKNLCYKTDDKTYEVFNRNYIQEKEERKQLENFTTGLISSNSNTSYEFLQKDIQDLYAPKDSFDTPLVFFNTTVLNHGKKGVFSPVNDSNLFCNNVDLLIGDQPVSFHFAEISSQSFPLLNNFSSFHDRYLGDGGIYENSGTSTTLDIYRRLRKHCNSKGYKVRFILLTVLNANEDEKEDTCKCVKDTIDDSKSIFTLLTNVVSKVPFAGHEGDAKASIKQQIKLNNQYLPDSAIRDSVFIIQPSEQFALSRVFSRKTLNKFINQKQLDSSLRDYSEFRRHWDSMDNLIGTKPGQKPDIYRVYTQYRNDSEKEKIKTVLNDQKITSMVLNIPPIDHVFSDNFGNEIRYFRKNDKQKADKLAALLFEITKVTFTPKYVSNKDLQEKTPEGQLELWIRSLKMPLR
jgi:hypothetical protein